MGTIRIKIVSFDEPAATATEVAEQLRATWPASSTPEFTAVCGHDLEPPDLGPCDAVVLVTDRDRQRPPVLSLISFLEESYVPMLALFDDLPGPRNFYEFAGAVVRRRDDDPAEAAAILCGLVHRQREIRQLRNELSLAHRYHGGLRGQINKMHEDLQLAAMVQREFLPRELPVLHGVEFGAMWRPAHYVSGDLYDVIRLDEDHVGVFVSDSIGHGVPAALMTMVISRSLTVKEIDGSNYRIIPPHEVLAKLNTHLIRRQGQTTRFATAVYAVVDCRSRRVTLAGAGHPAPILMRGDGTTEYIETPGGLLGVFQGEEYGQVELEMRVEDRLMIYSDGFEQAFPDDKSEDAYQVRKPTRRYLEEFQALRTADTAAEMIERLRRRVNDQAGSLHQVDDLTMLCVRSAALGATDPDQVNVVVLDEGPVEELAVGSEPSVVSCQLSAEG